MTTEKLQITIKTKDGIRVFNLSLGRFSQETQDHLKQFFKKDFINLEDLLQFCISQTDALTSALSQNKILKTESQNLQQEIEKLCQKLENL